MSEIEIPFYKLHGDENDFLISWADRLPELDLPQAARSICARNTGVGADGWILSWLTADGLKIRLFNADGSEPEMSGNGSRCAAAFAYLEERTAGAEITLTTGAGPKRIKLIDRKGSLFCFEMDMGLPRVEELRTTLRFGERDWDASILNVGNPQCAVFVKEFPNDWRTVAAEIEAAPQFPQRTNVSLVKVLSPHAIEVLFYERGAGETRSSGTGSTGAGAAAILRGEVKSPLEISTPAGRLNLQWQESILLTGPAALICRGVYVLEI